MTNKNPVLRIQIPQILTSNFMMKYYYDDSIKEVSESKGRVSMTQSHSQSAQAPQKKKYSPNNNKSKIISLEEMNNSTKKQVKQDDEKKFFEEEKKSFIKEHSSKFRDSNNSSNSLKLASLDNTLKPPNNHQSKLEFSNDLVEAFRSVNKILKVIKFIL